MGICPLQSAYYLPKKKTEVNTKVFYGVGDPNFSQIEASKYANRGIANTKKLKNLVSLSETYDEVVSISNLFPKKTLFLGNKANEIQLKAQQDFSNSIMYFATHSVPLMSEISLQPGLALTPPQSASINDDGLLTASEILDINFNNSYISLAACNTYQELYPGSEKFSGFAESFFAAGRKAWFYQCGILKAYLLQSSTPRCMTELSIMMKAFKKLLERHLYNLFKMRNIIIHSFGVAIYI